MTNNNLYSRSRNTPQRIHLFTHTVCLAIALVILAAGLSSVSLHAQNNGNAFGKAKKLAKANRYVYHVWSRNASGTDGYIESEARLVEDIAGDTALLGKRYAVIQVKLNGKSAISSRFERSDDLGIYLVKNNGKTLTEEQQVRFDAKRGDAQSDGVMLVSAVENRSVLTRANTVFTLAPKDYNQSRVIYATEFGIIDNLSVGNSGKIQQSVRLVGAVIDGIAYGDTTSNIASLKPTALYATDIRTIESGACDLRYHLQQVSDVRLVLRDSVGTIIRTIIDDNKDGKNTIEGQYSISCDMSDRRILPGLYSFQLWVNKKLIGEQVVRKRDRGWNPIVYDIAETTYQQPGVDCGYYLTKANTVTVTVRTDKGVVVSTLYSGAQARGEYSYRWNGRDSKNTKVAPGTYYMVVESSGLPYPSVRPVVVP